MKEILLYYIANYPVFIILFIGLFLLLRNNSIVDDDALKEFWIALPLMFILTIAETFDIVYAASPDFTYVRVVTSWLKSSLEPFIVIVLVDLLALHNKKLIIAFYSIGTLNSLLYATILLQNKVPSIGRIVGYFDESNEFQIGSFLVYSSQVITVLIIIVLILYSIDKIKTRKKESAVVFFITASFTVIAVLETLNYIEHQLNLIVVSCLIIYYLFLNMQISRIDPTTGLYNRQAFYADVKQNGSDITGVIALDMNGLKAINDNIGHKAGDIALNALAEAFRKGTKKFPKTVIYRTGGDEFTILYYEDPAEINQMCKVIRNFVDDTEYTCSVGFAAKENESDKLEDLEKLADERMYADKAKFYSLTGKDRRK